MNLPITFVNIVAVEIKDLTAIDKLQQIYRSLLIINTKSLLFRQTWNIHKNQTKSQRSS